jgi:hypothetical protein
MVQCARAEADFWIANLGGMVALSPMSAKANQAVADGKIDFEDWQVMGGSIMVDHRMAADLLENLKNDGFTIGEE